MYVNHRVLTWENIFNTLVAALTDQQDQQRRTLAVTMLKKISQQLRQADLFRVRTGISQEDKAAALRDFIWQHHAEVAPTLTLQVVVWEPASYERLFGQDIATLINQMHQARSQQPDNRQWEPIPLDEQQRGLQLGQQAPEENPAELVPLAVNINGRGGLQNLQQGAFPRGSEQALRQYLLVAFDRGEDGRDILRQLHELNEARRVNHQDAADEDMSFITNNGLETYADSQDSVRLHGGGDQFGTPMQMARPPQLITPATHAGGNEGVIAAPFIPGK